MIVLALALAGAALSRRRWLIAGVGTLAGIRIAGPIAFVVAAVVSAVLLVQRMSPSRRVDASANDTDELVAIRATSLGVAAGLGYDQAVREAATAVGGSVGAALSDSLRRRAAGIREPTGFDALDAMQAEAHRSALTGAPLGPALDALATSIRRARTEQTKTRLARLPVKLLFPLALLILPGFVLMSVGPAVLGGLARLDL